MEQLQREVEARRATVPSLKKLLADLARLNLPGLEHVSSRAHEQLEKAAEFRTSGEAQNEINCYSTAAACCDELEKFALRFKKHASEVDKLLPDAPKGE
jgi:hypothetical protein